MTGSDTRARQLQRLLLHLAGRIGDHHVARLRGRLAAGPADVGPDLVAVLRDGRVRVTPAELDLLTEALGAPPTVHVHDFPALRRFTFEPGDTGDTAGDRAAVDAAAAHGTARGLWRAWRQTANGTHPAATAVYVVELDGDGDPVAATDAVQRAVAAAGEEDPQVEVYPLGADLPSYQRLARGGGRLLWAREPDPGVEVVATFDLVDPELGPRFRPGRPHAGAAERQPLVDYLRGGEPLLFTTKRMDDVVDPALGNVVPMTFRTDGRWVWSDAAAYYLDRHGLLPDPRLAAHARALGFAVPVVDGAARHRAMAALRTPPAGV